MPPPLVLPFRPVAALGALLLVAGAVWAACMPMVQTLACHQGECQLTDAGLAASWTRRPSLRGARVVSHGGGALAGATRWLVVLESAEGEVLLGLTPVNTEAEARAQVTRLTGWLAGDRRDSVRLQSFRGPAAYGLPAAVAGLGLALLALAGVLRRR